MPNVTVISSIPKLKKKKNVAAYARVSSGKDAMLHSLSAQVNYYSKLIQSRKEWNYVGVYADEAFTGTKADRPDFIKLMNDCRDGKIDIVICKSISRFARNTVTLLESVRELRTLGIDVYFEEQNIHSLSSDGDLMLSILASCAQEESRSVSENMLWRIKKDFEQGTRWGAKDRLGYKVVDKELVIVPEEAEIVRRIFDMYLSGMGDQKIANTLNDEGVKTFTNKKWYNNTIKGILTNPDNAGYLVLQKTYREDHISKKKKLNKGVKPKFEVEEDHEGIVDKETFEKACAIRKERTHVSEQRKPSLFSGMIKCSCCGHNFKHKTRGDRNCYICSTLDQEGKEKCRNKQIRDEIIIAKTCEVLGMDAIDRNVITEKIKEIIANDNNTLIYKLINGNEETVAWANPSRSSSWTPEMKEKASIRAKEQNERKRTKLCQNK